MLGLMGFSGSLPLYVIHILYLCLLIGQIKMLAKDACLLTYLLTLMANARAQLVSC